MPGTSRVFDIGPMPDPFRPLPRRRPRGSIVVSVMLVARRSKPIRHRKKLAGLVR